VGWFWKACETVGSWLWRNRDEVVGVGEWAYEWAANGRRRTAACRICGAMVPCTIIEGRYAAVCPIHGISSGEAKGGGK